MGPKKNNNNRRRDGDKRLPLKSVENVTTTDGPQKPPVQNFAGSSVIRNRRADQSENWRKPEMQRQQSNWRSQREPAVRNNAVRNDVEVKECSNRQSEQSTSTIVYQQKFSTKKERNIGVRSFESKFTSFLEGIDPVFRNACNIQNIGEDVAKLIEELNKIGIDTFWPFENPDFHTNIIEMRKIFDELFKIVKTCFMFLCYQRGLRCIQADKSRKYSNAWKNSIDVDAELITLKEVVKKLKSLCEEKNWTDGDLSFSNNVDKYFDILIPAVKACDIEVLSNNGIEDRLNSISSRKSLGFKISVEDVDNMLSFSLKQRGFGDFTATASQCVEVFTTSNQLEQILEKSGEMLKIIDIRCGNAALKAVTRLFKHIPNEEVAGIFEKSDKFEKSSMNRFLGYPPNEILSRATKAEDVFKLFYLALPAKCSETHMITIREAGDAIRAFYALFDMQEVNQMLVQICCHPNYDKNQKHIIIALKHLPDSLKKTLEIGEEFVSGDYSNNENSLYFQIGNGINKLSSDKQISKLVKVLISTKPDNILSYERIFRMCIKSMNLPESKNVSNVLLTIGKDLRIAELNFSKDFVQDLLLSMLRVYSFPVDVTNIGKYEFITKMLKALSHVCENNGKIQLDGDYLVQEWEKLNHPWFVKMYLQLWFPVLYFQIKPIIVYPWSSIESPKTSDYGELVKLSTSWPNCCHMDFLIHCIDEVLPNNSIHVELLEEMLSRVDDLEVNDRWKDRLKSAYKSKIEVLKSAEHVKPSEIPTEITENVETGEKKEDEIEKSNEVEKIPERIEEKTRNIVGLPEDKGKWATHLNSEVWDALTSAQKDEVRKYRFEISRNKQYRYVPRTK